MAINAYDQAAGDLNNLLLHQPKDAEALLQRGHLQYLQQKWPAAINDYSQSMALEPAAATYVHRGMAWHRAGHLQNALDDFNRALEKEPNLALAFSCKGDVFYDQANYREAIRWYSEAVEIQPNDADTWNNRGNAFTRLSQYQQALSDYDRALSIRNEPHFRTNRAFCWLQLGQGKAAAQVAQQELAVAPANAAALHLKGRTLLHEQRFKEAIEAFDKSAALEAGRPDLYFERATAYYYLKEYYKSVEDLMEALRLRPNYSQAEQLMTECFRQMDVQNRQLIPVGTAVEQPAQPVIARPALMKPKGGSVAGDEGFMDDFFDQ